MTHETDVTFVRDEVDWDSMSAPGSYWAKQNWAEAMAAAEHFEDDLPLDDKSFQGLTIREEYQNHFRDYGAWDDEEIDSWTDQELRALVIQETALEIKEAAQGEMPNHTYEEEDDRLYHLSDGFNPKRLKDQMMGN